mgnify:FL=1
MLVGVKVDQYANVMVQGNEKTGDKDYYVKIGNGDTTTGRLLINRSSLNIIDGNRIYNADLTRRYIGGVYSDYLETENDSTDSIALILFKKIDPINFPFMKNKDDYLVKVKPGEIITITNLFGENFTVINSLDAIDSPAKVETNENTFTLVN